MGSIELDDPVVNGDLNSEGISDNVNKLQNIVQKLTEENDLPSSPKQKLSNGFSNNVVADPYSLENTQEVSEFECDTDLDSEDSWLFESPQKISRTPGQSNTSPDKWLKENITTPELMRVRGSLSAKLDVIAIENRKGRMTDPVDRKRSKGRAESINSVNSLDWDYDEDKIRSSKQSSLPLHEDGLSYDNDFDADAELKSYQGRDRQAWSEPAGKMQLDPNDPRPFSLDWSDDEDDLVPMKIDFNSPQAPQKRMIAPNPTVIKRGINNLAAPRQPDTYEYDDLVAKPQGGVKPRRAVQPIARAPKQTENVMDDDITDYGQDDFNDSAPVVPRGAVKPRATKAKKKTSFAENILIHPIRRDEYEEEEAPKAIPQHQRLLINPKQSPSPRAVGIAKPVQRRKPGGDDGDSGPVRARTSASASNLVRPRTSVPNMNKSASASDVSDSSLKAKLPVGGDGPVVRRRGAPTPSDAGPTIRKPKEQPQIARVQGIPQVRKSTGSIPEKSGGGIARPRRSQSPSGMVRPRGSGMTTQSYQANY